GQDIPLPPGVPPADSSHINWGQWENTDTGGHKRRGTSSGGREKGGGETKEKSFIPTTTHTPGGAQGGKKEGERGKGCASGGAWNGEGELLDSLRTWEEGSNLFRETLNAAGERTLEGWVWVDGRRCYEVQVFEKGTGNRLLYGRYENGGYVVETWKGGVKTATE